MPSNEQTHAGHRQRMRERYRDAGLDSFAPHEVLELLLFFAIPRQNVNPLAHRLVDHFGSLQGVFSASPEELLQVDGIGESAATLLSLFLPATRYAARQQQHADRPMLSNLRMAKDYCQHLFADKAEEVLYVISLDAQGRVLRATPAIIGTIDELTVYPRTVVSEALRHRAQAVLLAHNHPSGVAEPSDRDLETNRALRDALATVDIQLLDHLIYADGECVSIRQWEEVQALGERFAELPRRAADVKRRRPRKNKQEPSPDET